MLPIAKTKLWLAQKGLKAGSAETRLRAVQRIRMLEDPSTLEVLVETLGDPDDAVRREVVTALGELQDMRAVQRLIGAVQDPAEGVQQAAIHALKRFGDGMATEALIRALHSGTSDVQWSAAHALKSMGWQPKTPADAIQYFVAIGDLHRTTTYGAAAIAALTSVLRSAAYQKRVAAVNALSEIDNPAVVKPLVEALKDDDPSVRTAAANGLSRFQHPQVAPGLVALLKDRDRNVRVAAAQAVGQLRDVNTIEPLAILLRDADWEVRSMAVQALGRIGDRQVLSLVMEALKDHDQEVRQQAAEALGSVGDETVIERLVVTMLDEHAGVRQAAARALIRIDPYWERSNRVQTVLPQIEAALRHNDSGVQYVAAGLLRRLTGRSAAETPVAMAHASARPSGSSLGRILVEMLQDSDADIRLAAVECVDRLKLAECAAALRTALNDSSKWVQTAAQAALQAGS